MPPINDFSDYDVFKTPGLYILTNQGSGTVLDLFEGRPEPGTKIIGFNGKNVDNQKWQIANVGDGKYLIISRKTGTYVTAPEDGERVVSNVGYPDKKINHWRIVAPDAGNPQIIQFQSVAHQGSVLELSQGSDKNLTPVKVVPQNRDRNGQKWLLTKTT